MMMTYHNSLPISPELIYVRKAFLVGVSVGGGGGGSLYEVQKMFSENKIQNSQFASLKSENNIILTTI